MSGNSSEAPRNWFLIVGISLALTQLLVPFVLVHWIVFPDRSAPDGFLWGPLASLVGSAVLCPIGLVLAIIGTIKNACH
jgi:hypothetical protein